MTSVNLSAVLTTSQEVIISNLNYDVITNPDQHLNGHYLQLSEKGVRAVPQVFFHFNAITQYSARLPAVPSDTTGWIAVGKDDWLIDPVSGNFYSPSKMLFYDPVSFDVIEVAESLPVGGKTYGKAVNLESPDGDLWFVSWDWMGRKASDGMPLKLPSMCLNTIATVNDATRLENTFVGIEMHTVGGQSETVEGITILTSGIYYLFIEIIGGKSYELYITPEWIDDAQKEPAFLVGAKTVDTESLNLITGGNKFSPADGYYYLNEGDTIALKAVPYDTLEVNADGAPITALENLSEAKIMGFLIQSL
jgi:hypothetical protein